MADGALRVVIAEDHYLVREGTRRVLQEDDSIVVVAAVATALELAAVLDREHVDVVVTDIRMPPGHTTEGIEAAHRLRRTHPTVGVVVLSQHADAAYAMDLLREGTAGRAYLLKEQVGDERLLVETVRAVAVGGSYIDPEVVAAMVATSTRNETSPIRDLTERELEVLEAMAQGNTNAGIADALHLSVSSIEKYVAAVFRKLDLGPEQQVHRRVAAVLTLLHAQARSHPHPHRGTGTTS